MPFLDEDEESDDEYNEDIEPKKIVKCSLRLNECSEYIFQIA